MRIFLDTNVLISALMGHGLCQDLLNKIISEHTVVLGAPERDELKRVLATKFKVPKEILEVVDAKLDGFEQAAAAANQLPVKLTDPDDLPIVSCAVEAGVDLLVTGDSALVALGGLQGMPVVTPRDCWIRLGGLS